MEYELYLSHSGVPDMTWGNRRYQYKDGSLTPLGKIHYRKLRKEKAEGDARHQPSEARKKAKYEEERKNILEKGKATDILRNKNKYNFTTEELNSAYKRINDRVNVEANLKALSAKETAKGKATVDKILDTATVWRNRAEKGFDIWNTIAKLHNSFVEEEDQWQQIGQPSVREKINKSKLEKKKAEERAAKEKAEKQEEYAKGKMALEAKIYNKIDNTSIDDLMKYSKNLNKKDLEDALAYMESQKTIKEVSNNKKKEEADARAKQKKEEADAIAKQNKYQAEVDAGKQKIEAAEKKAQEYQRNRVLARYYYDHGSVEEIMKNKEIFTPTEFRYALAAAEERKKKNK